MQTSGYLHERLNLITNVPGRPLDKVVQETYERLTLERDDVLRNLQRMALRYVLRTSTSCKASEDMFGAPFLFDPFWGGALSVNRLDYAVYQDDTEVTLQVMGPRGNDPLVSSSVSQEYRITPESVTLDDDIVLYPYQIVGLSIDLLAATNTPALAEVNKTLRG
ncbi:MAG TPA: hypothetical protein VF733_06830 [Candidatus Saccharimonadales bacterium]